MSTLNLSSFLFFCFTLNAVVNTTRNKRHKRDEEQLKSNMKVNHVSIPTSYFHLQFLMLLIFMYITRLLLFEMCVSSKNVREIEREKSFLCHHCLRVSTTKLKINLAENFYFHAKVQWKFYFSLLFTWCMKIALFLHRIKINQSLNSTLWVKWTLVRVISIFLYPKAF